ncbi:hypothetical protein D922_02152 [Enterococcus faecalis 06-MB-DW-09]|nr:hypothetical protein D931_01074 [Enterococcus faecium 13.SD.W.09]EPH93087.1 hypothetical protein D922_02152 [Enterococcus faecalis 06-MB-DW-09]
MLFSDNRCEKKEKASSLLSKCRHKKFTGFVSRSTTSIPSLSQKNE